MAYAVYQQAGGKFTPWATFNSGSYKSHLGAAAPAGAQVSGTTNGPLKGFNLGDILNDLGKLFQPALWMRVGIGGLGLLLVVLGIVFILGKADVKVTKSVGLPPVLP